MGVLRHICHDGIQHDMAGDCRSRGVQVPFERWFEGSDDGLKNASILRNWSVAPNQLR